MITPGLVSITFRQLAPDHVVSLAREANLGSIEWGGDVHVPHGDLARAREVRRLSDDAGLSVSAYGSYYRAGVSESQGLAFGRVLDTAVALGAPTIRVWAGVVGSAAAHAATRAVVAADLARVCELARRGNACISLEFHADTLADTAEGALALLREVAHPSLTTFWQPPNGEDAADALRGLALLLPHVSNLHVFHWWPDHRHRLPLAAGADRWRSYLALASQGVRPRHASLEFVPGESPEAFRADAATLRELLASPG